MIKYQFAYDTNKVITNVADLTHETIDRSKKFVCISCNSELVPHLGKVRQKYFAHKPDSVCSRETYLHSLTKNLIYQEFKKCLQENIPFYIELFKPKKCNAAYSTIGIMCDLESELLKHDLTKFYTDIKLEQRHNNFKPDLLLIGKNDVDNIYIEVAVTHFSEKKKTDSKIRIIELFISDEKDIIPITTHCISQGSFNVQFMNFHIKQDIGNHCNNRCKRKLDFFVVEQNGESTLKEMSLTYISNYLRTNSKNIAYYDISPKWKSDSKFRYLISKSYLEGIAIKDCFSCRYHGEDEYYFNVYWSIFCKFLKTKYYTTEAANCKYFVPERTYIDEHIKDGERDLKIMKDFPTVDDFYDYRIIPENPL